MIEAYPLHWPANWPRTKLPERSRFKQRGRIGFVHDEVWRELQLLGASRCVISSNIAVRQDGNPYSKQRRIEDPGVAVYFRLDGADQCFPCDRWDRVEDNLWAVAKSISALRGLDRWGAKTMVAAAFRGFKALPEATGPTTRRSAAVWLSGYFEASPEDIERDPLVAQMAVRAAAKKCHPDRRGGNDSLWHEFTAAKQAIST